MKLCPFWIHPDLKVYFWAPPLRQFFPICLNVEVESASVGCFCSCHTSLASGADMDLPRLLSLRLQKFPVEASGFEEERKESLLFKWCQFIELSVWLCLMDGFEILCCCSTAAGALLQLTSQRHSFRVCNVGHNRPLCRVNGLGMWTLPEILTVWSEWLDCNAIYKNDGVSGFKLNLEAKLLL